jgi:DNA-directed RNA polymerase subunit RPC12/RpoP
VWHHGRRYGPNGTLRDNGRHRMNAVKIAISSNDELARLRQRVLYGLALDAVSPTVAYVCGQCATIIGFSGAFDLVSVRDVDCPECGAFNTLQAA